MGQPNRQYESMTRLKLGPYTIRVWRTEPQLAVGFNADIRRAIEWIEPEGIGERPFDAVACDVAEALDALPNIAAYEILDEDGDGAIVYPDWK